MTAFEIWLWASEASPLAYRPKGVADMAMRNPKKLTVVSNPPFEYPEPKTPLGKRLIELAKQAEAAGVEPLTVEQIEEYLGRELGGIARQIRKGRRG